MKKLIALLAMVFLLAGVQYVQAQDQLEDDTTELADVDTTALVADSAMAVLQADLSGDDSELNEEEGGGLHKQLKRKFIEGSAGFMSLVALALVLGLAFCIERIIYLTLSEVDTKRLVNDVDAKLQQNDVEGAKALCRDTRGPVASICYQGLMHIKEPLEQIDRQLTNYGMVQISKMEKGCTWIRLFIAVAPSLGFLGTVIGMVMAFDRIQTAGDISPTIVAEGMKVALITTIFGIIVAIVLQFFYNYILSKIEHLTAQMEEGAIVFMDSVTEYKMKNEKGGNE
ncbi:MAG: MotA/TolQ/ExbB proton channel family protein [Prevotella sp.]|jgi:biopolymer transport protein ExbB|nr:MotA/TolQ/ExbB proton channel family protein [Prevotella sp.]